MSKGISQTVSTSDSTSIPTYQLKKAINIIENAKVMNEELKLSNQKIIILDSVLSIKDKKIAEYKIKDSVNDKVILAHKSVIANLNKTILNSDLSYELLNMKLAGEKRKKWVTLVLGIGVGYLLFH